MKTLFFTVCSIILLASCDISKNKDIPATDNFTKIYDNGKFSGNYYPLDIRQTSDGGFVILGEADIKPFSEFLGVYLLKTDKEGNFVWEHLSQDYTNPVSGLVGTGDDLKVFCMNKVQEAQFLTVAESPTAKAVSLNGTNLTFPLAASQNADGSFLLQNYEKFLRQTRFSKLGADLNKVWTNTFDIKESKDCTITYHYQRKIKPLPFFTGIANDGTSYFNGLNNYTLSWVFVNGGGTPTNGLVQGTRYNSGLSSALALQNGKFALSRYKESGENVFITQGNVVFSEVKTATNLLGNELPELTSQARVITKKATIETKNVVFYLSDTKNGQVAVFAYDEATGSLLGTKYLGAINKFEAGNLCITNDGGIAIIGRAYVVGRFPRFCLFKLSKDELKALVGL
jgi:hypothetical protein